MQHEETKQPETHEEELLKNSTITSLVGRRPRPASRAWEHAERRKHQEIR